MISDRLNLKGLRELRMTSFHLPSSPTKVPMMALNIMASTKQTRTSDGVLHGCST
jgi:hypothetical protein